MTDHNNNNGKNIWIFHHYATPPTINGFTRPYSFGIHLKNMGYDITVFASSYIHLSDYNLITNNVSYIENMDTEIPFVFVNTPPSSNGYFKRIINMFAFYRRLFKVTTSYMKNHAKPDIIIASSPHPLTMIAGLQIAKKLHIPCICEVRDFWPEVFFMGGQLKKESFLGKLLIKGEHWIYKNADALIFLKEGDVTYITDHHWAIEQGGDIDLNKCYYINNGVDLESFDKQAVENILEDPDLISGKFNVVCTGTIRPVNNVGNILDAAALLKEYTDIQFLIFGDGNELEKLKQRVVDEGLSNVKLKGYVEKKYIPFILSKAKVNILNYSQSKYNWSRGNSSNKLFEYMASGKPIISTVKMGYNILDKYRCGLSLKKDTPEELAKCILEVRDMPRYKYDRMCINARKGASHFDYKILSNKLHKVIDFALSKKRTS
ncbi:MAG: glycosyltransferase family 4 protein [Clostridiales bacterium]|nr:glycosyltransferase family 4 protein [Clostridiales bacterium]